MRPVTFSFEDESKRLRRLNIIAGILHLIQGISMLILGVLLEFSADIYVIYSDFFFDLENFDLSITPTPEVIYTLENIGVIVASFLIITAIFHLMISSILNKRYNLYLERRMNPYRWIEYSITSSIMIVIISILFSILDFWTLFLIFFLNFNMIMFGLLMESNNEGKERINWTSFILGCVSGIVVWMVIIAYFYGVSSNLGESPPDFVIIIFWVELILFNIFAINMVLQYKKLWLWKDYIFGEKVYIYFSLISKTLLAWLVFFGIFQPN